MNIAIYSYSLNITASTFRKHSYLVNIIFVGGKKYSYYVNMQKKGEYRALVRTLLFLLHMCFLLLFSIGIKYVGGVTS